MTLLDGFWRTRQDVNAAATLRHCYDWMDRLGWLANFDRVAERRTEGPRPGWQFSDSEVYKLMEALAWECGRSGDEASAALLDELTARVAAAQDADGYLNTCFGHAGQNARYSDLEQGHELYCTGHLLQAAIARLRTAGDDGVGPGTRLLGAFRACGLLVPVWDLDPDRESADYEDALAEFMERYAGVLGSDTPLTAEERRARSGLLSRQVTLR